MKGSGSSSRSRIHKRSRNINTSSSRIHKRRRNKSTSRSRHKTREAHQEEFTMKGIGGGGSRSQEKKKTDDEYQQTVDCLISKRIIRFDKLFPPADPMKTDNKKRKVDSQVRKRRIRFNRNFPCDIIFEILARTTFETLDACTHISKEWRDLITDQRFRDVYQKKHNINLYDEKEWLDFNTDEIFIEENRNNKKFPGYLLQRRQHSSIFVPLNKKNCHPSVRNRRIPKGKEILASSKQGLVICRDRCGNYFVGKPAARKWITMPKPVNMGGNEELSGQACHGIVVLGLSPLWYKVVKLDWGGHYLFYQIFDSKLRKWGKVKVFDCVVRAMVSPYCPTICVSESIYWQTFNQYVVAFNGLNDSFSIILLPICIPWCEYQIHEFNGHLGLVGEDAGGELELWEMFDNISNTSTWRKWRVGDYKDLKKRRKHNILHAKVQDEIIHHRKCDFVGDRCCQVFPFGF